MEVKYKGQGFINWKKVFIDNSASSSDLELSKGYALALDHTDTSTYVLCKAALATDVSKIFAGVLVEDVTIPASESAWVYVAGPGSVVEILVDEAGTAGDKVGYASDGEFEPATTFGAGTATLMEDVLAGELAMAVLDAGPAVPSVTAD